MSHNALHCILPPDVLARVARSGSEAAKEAALRMLQLDHSFRQGRAEAAGRTGGSRQQRFTFNREGGHPQRSIYDQQHSEDQTMGVLKRGEGQPANGDPAVDEAYDGFGATYSLYWDIFQRDSIDGQGEAILGAVHFSTDYDNAFWDGAGHMFFGDGDGQVLTRTTASLDVIGHELTHGVTQNEANLAYSGQSGALNESMSDCIGSLVKQYKLGQNAATADWLIGAEIVGPELAPALRSLKAPGTANAHDTQPADMDHYVKTASDNGGVHANSGIPNHAFYVVATTIGGNAWDAAGAIWYGALRDPRLTETATFAQFARITYSQAQTLYGAASKEAQAVEAGWDAVKVTLA